MRSTRFVPTVCAAAILGWVSMFAQAQPYPTRPIRIVTSPIGGALDVASRVLAQSVTGSLGQSVIVDNRPAMLGIESVRLAAPDGYTIMLAADSFWVAPLLQKTSYDPLMDFSPITKVLTTPLVVTVHPSVRANSIRELIALAKARPGELNYGTGATGGLQHLAVEYFKASAGVDLVRIPYKGGGPAVIDLLAGNIQILFFTFGSVKPHVATGQLRALAVTSAQRSAVAPDLPTVAESGLPGFEASSIFGVFARAGTPAPILQRLNREFVTALNNPDLRQGLLREASADAGGSSPEQFAEIIKADIARMSKVIKDSGIREQ